MDADFWRSRWRSGRIGFHRDDVHPLLVRYASRMAGRPRVLVPLAGKSLDMHFLRDQGHHVIGVELVEDAGRAFFSEAGMTPVDDRPEVGSRRALVLRAQGFDIHIADFFQTTPRELGRLDAVYDRASLIALPVDTRARYAAHLASLLPPDTVVLMITVDYDAREMSGPPFSVPPAEVEAIFGGPFEVSTLETLDDALDDSPNLRERGLTRLREHVLWLRRRG